MRTQLENVMIARVARVTAVSELLEMALMLSDSKEGAVRAAAVLVLARVELLESRKSTPWCHNDKGQGIILRRVLKRLGDKPWTATA